MYNITDEAVQCIKVIVDSNRCESCDNLDGERVRHQCGHSYCGACVAKLEHCLRCATPPGADEQTSLTDSPAARRAKNAVALLNTFQQAFNVDVYMRSRISDQLRAEKEVFPDCIQAPVKYYNKRKSSIVQSNKENRWQSFFPGELISPKKSSKMENSLNYVQHWLHNNEKEIPKKSPRKAFADLDVNSPNALKRQITRRADSILTEDKKGLKNTPKKRKTSFKSSLALVKKQSILDKHLKPVNQQKEFQNFKKGFGMSPKANAMKVLHKSDKDESGIVIDEDDPIIIEDSHSQVVDKDELAWKAVIQANEESPYVSQSLNLEHGDVIKNSYDIRKNINQSIPCNKVPFYKRSYFTETCNLCTKIESESIQNYNQIAVKPDDISITIESNTLVATIKMTSVKDRSYFEKHSVSVQTDIHNPVCYDLGGVTAPQKQISGILLKSENEPFLDIGKKIVSQDLFTAEIKPTAGQKTKTSIEQTSNKSTHQMIADSDSDDAFNESNIMEVSAEVHHFSEIKPQALAEIVPSKVQHRAKRSNRGHTPNSSDSSDKENFDPNRSKRLKLDKKDTKKRKRYYK